MISKFIDYRHLFAATSMFGKNVAPKHLFIDSLSQYQSLKNIFHCMGWKLHVQHVISIPYNKEVP